MLVPPNYQLTDTLLPDCPLFRVSAEGWPLSRCASYAAAPLAPWAGSGTASGVASRKILRTRFMENETPDTAFTRTPGCAVVWIAALCAGGPHPFPAPHRSEEHTSELQSLMRISYAVFCLKKKKILNKQHNQ